MSTTIEWTQRPGTKGETWNPTTGCNKLSAGCKHCYAEVMHKRLQAMGMGKYEQDFSAGVVTHADTLTIPLKWKKPRTVFVNSMSDLFHADVPFDFIDQVFAVMALTPQHTYQILTKRPERMAEYLAGLQRAADDHAPLTQSGQFSPANVINLRNLVLVSRGSGVGGRGFKANWPLPNVWLGTSVENQAAADERIPHLLRCPAAVRFLSCEPLLGAVDLRHIRIDGPEPDLTYYIDCLNGYHQGGLQWGDREGSAFVKIDWVIGGGESGHTPRPMLPEWPRGLRDQCKAAKVPFFFKQWGEWHTKYFLTFTGEAVFHQFRTFGQWVDKASTWVQGGICLDRHGKQLKNGKDFMEARDNDAFPVTIMHKVGKHNSGNVLDGVVHQEWPKVESNTYTDASS